MESIQSPQRRNRYLKLKMALFLTAVFAGKITPRKLWNVFACTMSYLLQRKISGASPFVLSLELWNECNAGCLFCRNEKGVIFNINPEQPTLGVISKGKMPAPMAMDIIDQVKKDVLVAVLYTNGEPLLYKELPNVIRFASQRKVMTMISSNGLLFTPENAKAILEAGIDFIKIQLSGFTQDIYSVQIRYGHVEKLKSNIRMLAEMKKQGGHHTLILIDYILYNYNKHQAPLVQAMCQELGLLYNTRPGNPKGGLEGKEPLQSTESLPLDMSCDWLWKGIQVNFNGDILQCCDGVIWSNPKVYEVYQTGKTNLKSVWNGPAARNLRITMATKGRGAIPMCSKCERKGVCFKW